MSMRLIESGDLVQMLPELGLALLHAERLPQWSVGFDNQCRVTLALGEAEELLPERTRRV